MCGIALFSDSRFIIRSLGRSVGAFYTLFLISLRHFGLLAPLTVFSGVRTRTFIAHIFYCCCFVRIHSISVFVTYIQRWYGGALMLEYVRHCKCVSIIMTLFAPHIFLSIFINSASTSNPSCCNYTHKRRKKWTKSNFVDTEFELLGNYRKIYTKMVNFSDREKHTYKYSDSIKTKESAENSSSIRSQLTRQWSVGGARKKCFLGITWIII